MGTIRNVSDTLSFDFSSNSFPFLDMLSVTTTPVDASRLRLMANVAFTVDRDAVVRIRAVDTLGGVFPGGGVRIVSAGFGGGAALSMLFVSPPLSAVQRTIRLQISVFGPGRVPAPIVSVRPFTQNESACLSVDNLIPDT